MLQALMIKDTWQPGRAMIGRQACRNCIYGQSFLLYVPTRIRSGTHLRSGITTLSAFDITALATYLLGTWSSRVGQHPCPNKHMLCTGFVPSRVQAGCLWRLINPCILTLLQGSYHSVSAIVYFSSVRLQVPLAGSGVIPNPGQSPCYLAVLL